MRTVPLVTALLLLFTTTVFHQQGGLVNGDSSASGGNQGESLPPECTEEFVNEPNHTMCMTDDPNVIRSGVSDEDKKGIVDLHNELRANVDPPATDLSKLIWDENIAVVAEKWAKQCQVGHDPNRGLPSYGVGIGQNAAGGYSNWHDAVMGWYNEVKIYQYGKDPEVYIGKDGWKQVGHYTQVVQNVTFRIGCGFAECSTGYKRIYICNYAHGQSRIQHPYTKGEQCSACKTSCKNGLCDCGGKLCLHGGSLDINTCTCSCNRLYQGDTCEQLNCPVRDNDYCWSGYGQELCTKYSNVPIECPYMCGVCGGPDAATPPPTVVSDWGCTYFGFLPTEDECKTYGSTGEDTTYCASRGGGFNCSDCTKYSNVKTDYCPVMCGYCTGPCDGLTCGNGGTLNRDTCKCQCTSLFKGDKCEIAVCDGKTCLNGGKLDPSTCQCDCRELTTGERCETVLCDGKTCYNGGKLDTTTCQCNCKELTTGERCETVLPPPETTSAFGCTYIGVRPSEAECAKYGDAGADKGSCASRGGGFTCGDCTKYSNVKTDYCPVMCGYCDGPCGGLTCMNGGKLNRETCTCECKKPYGGESCADVHCPESDAGHCWTQWPQEYCKQYGNVKHDCPWMCGLCGEAGATPPPVYTSSHNCTYQGKRPTPEQCKAYGNNGQDNWACQTNGGGFGCSDCKTYSNVKTDYCPVMCAYCDP